MLVFMTGTASEGDLEVEYQTLFPMAQHSAPVFLWLPHLKLEANLNKLSEDWKAPIINYTFDVTSAEYETSN